MIGQADDRQRLGWREVGRREKVVSRDRVPPVALVTFERNAGRPKRLQVAKHRAPTYAATFCHAVGALPVTCPQRLQQLQQS